MHPLHFVLWCFHQLHLLSHTCTLFESNSKCHLTPLPLLRLFLSRTLPLQAVPCPNASPWVLNKVYKPGDRVSSYDHLGVHNNIYECNAYPWNEACGQAGFQPGQDEIGPGPPQNEPKPSWKIAWTLVGPCTYTPVSLIYRSSNAFTIVTHGHDSFH